MVSELLGEIQVTRLQQVRLVELLKGMKGGEVLAHVEAVVQAMEGTLQQFGEQLWDLLGDLLFYPGATLHSLHTSCTPSVYTFYNKWFCQC